MTTSAKNFNFIYYPNYLATEATELHFMHYSRVVITLFNIDQHKSAFSAYSFKKLVFVFTALCFLYIPF